MTSNTSKVPLAVHRGWRPRVQHKLTGWVDYTIAVAKGRSPSAVERAGEKVPGGTIGFFFSCVNLLKTIMGSGMLCLPSAFQALSLGPGFLLLFFAALVSAQGMYLLARAALQVSGGRNADFALLAKATYPRLAPVFDLAILLKCLGVAIAYLVVAGSLMPQLVAGVWGGGAPGMLLNVEFWITVSAVLIFPMVCMPRMDSLKYTSFLGMLSIVYIIGLSAYLLARGPSFPIPLWEPAGPVKVIKNFGVFVFAFTCHQNVLPIQSEARNNSARGMLQIIAMCVTVSLALYLAFTVFSLAVFGGLAIPDNVLELYPGAGPAFMVARFLYVCLVLFSFPLQTFPARNSTIKILAYFSPAFSAAKAQAIYRVSTGAIMVFVWALSCTGLNLKLVLRAVGSTTGPTLCYILPSVFWLRLEAGRPWGTLTYAAAGLLAFGAVSIVISSTALFL